MIIKIGSQNYTVKERSRHEDGMLNDGSYGYTLDNGNLIVIDKDIAKGKKQITLLHEILHAIRLNNEGLPKPKRKDDFDTWEHYFIGLYESNFLAVIKDNPSLMDWFSNEQTN